MASTADAIEAEDINELKDIEQNSLDELGLFMESVPFQTLSTIADDLEDRLQNLSDNMFKAPSEFSKEGKSARKGANQARRGSTLDRESDDDGSHGSKQGRRQQPAAFITDVEEVESRPSSRQPATCIEDVVIDYPALIDAPQPPPNCKTEVVLQHVSEGILEQWSDDQWNVYFLSPLSVDIMNDLFWYFFLQELALARVSLTGEGTAATQAKLEPSQQHLKAQEVMFRRVSDNYMELFWKVGLTMLTDDFFDRYSEALCSAVGLAFETGLHDSAYQFQDPEFQGRLMDIFANWITGLAPRRLRKELKLEHPDDEEHRSRKPAASPGKLLGHRVRRNYKYFNAVGHSPLVESYMQRHGLKCQIGGTKQRNAVATHRLRRIEVAVNADKIKWRQKRRVPVKVPPRAAVLTEKKAHTAAAGTLMTSVMPQIHSTCGMGTFSQKKVDEEFLKYLNG